jgi:hypothetical protein
MPSPETLAHFIARVEQGAHVEAIEAYYHEEATMQENLDPPRTGRAALVANEARALSKVRSVHSRCIGPVFVNGEHVVIRWHFRFERLDGKVQELEELAYQQWHGERILTEQFFYDPGQFVAR